MIYKAIDKWNGNYLEHRDHKYIKKIGTGSNTRYFYSTDEYNAYLKKTGQKQYPLGSGIYVDAKEMHNVEDGRIYKPREYTDKKDYSEDNPWNSKHLQINRKRKFMTNDLGPQSKAGYRATGTSIDIYSTLPGPDTHLKEYYKPTKLTKKDKDPRWVLHQVYKPKATKAEKAIQAAKNKKVKTKQWLSNFFNTHK